ncbi:MAG: nuclear transport factor 2 family protein [Betaproteobacteria bacterium]|nr:nuclear transport factor 2 family protein [Betaproteobacteria bacterium]
MPARNPEEIDRLFSDALNAGNLDALVALYEPQAALSPEPGKAVVGTRAIREALSGFLAMKPKMAMTTRILAQGGDIALLTSKWDLSGTAADGAPVKMSGQSAEVCRRQKDGSWLFAIDNPWGLT